MGELSIQSMETTRPEDATMIYDQIEDFGEFDQLLRVALHSKRSGMLPELWSQQQSGADALSALAKIAPPVRMKSGGSIGSSPTSGRTTMTRPSLPATLL